MERKTVELGNATVFVDAIESFTPELELETMTTFYTVTCKSGAKYHRISKRTLQNVGIIQ